VQLGDQLAMLIRGINYEAWHHPAGKPEKIRSREEFLARINARLPTTRLIGPEDGAPEQIRTLWARSLGAI
jgi:uncharacterized protein (DUF2267 family)